MAGRLEERETAHRLLRVLLVEDNPVDAEMTVALLKRAGYPLTFETVDQRPDFEQAMERNHYDLILCDHNLRSWTGLEALEILKKSGRDIPFVVLTAVLGDEAAVEYIKQGAADYVLKHRLERLPVAVRQALRDKAHRDEAARLSEQILAGKREWELTFDSVPSPVLLLKVSGEVARANQALTELTGKRFSEVIGKPCWEVLSCERAGPEKCPHQQTMKTGRFSRREELIHVDGRIFECTASPQRDPAGNLSGTVIVLHDLTQRRRAEEKVLAERQRLFAVLESVPVMICLLTTDYHVAFSNRSFRQLFGEAQGRHCYEYCFGLQQPCDFCKSFEPLRTGQPHHWEVATPSGRIIDVHDFPFQDADGSPMILEMDIDITEARRAREALRESEERFRTAFRASPEPITISRLCDGVYVDVNDAFLRILGFERQEVVGHTPQELNTWTDLGARDEIFRELQERRSVRDRQLDFRTRQGEIRTVLLSAEAVELAGELCALMISMDVTERNRAEEALRQSMEQNRLLADMLENSGQPFAVGYPDGRIGPLNQAFERLTGYTRKELEQVNWAEVLTPPEWGDMEKARLGELARTGMPVRYEKEYLRKDGSRVPIELLVHLRRDEGGQPAFYYAFVTDLRERKRLEEQFLQAQKMDAVGRLAGGVAHDFNNLLTIIRGYADMLLEGAAPAGRERGHLEEIRRAGERASALTRQLLAFSRKQVVKPAVLDLNAIVEGMQKMLRRLIGEDIEFHTHFAPDLGQIKADAGQIEQVVMNLAVNARDAMPRGGRLSVETGNVELEEAYARSHPYVTPGRYVQLSVSDNGCGMNAETQSHIFEPFFTTKGQGKGTGLGLPTAYGIVKQSGGHINVYSEVGRGTVFKVYFPRIDEPAETDAPWSGPTVQARGTETVLLVEDEPGVRALAAEALRADGYTVLEAGDAEQALALLAQHPEVIHLLLTDVVMPGINGKGLADQLSHLRPEMKVLFISGYTADAISQHGILQEGTAFLSKPFTPRELLAKLRQALAA